MFPVLVTVTKIGASTVVAASVSVAAFVASLGRVTAKAVPTVKPPALDARADKSTAVPVREAPPALEARAGR